MKLDQKTLLAAAMRVFAKAGLEGASMRAIAREAGCDPSLIYYYFENKEAIFSAILDERLPPMAADLRQLADPQDPRSTAEKLWTILQLFRERGSDGGFRSLIRQQIALGAGGLSEMVARKLLPAHLSMRRIVRRGIRTGELRSDLSPILTVLYLIRMEFELMDLIPAYSMRLARIEPKQALALAERNWFEVLWRGIASDPLTPLSFLPPMPTLRR